MWSDEKLVRSSEDPSKRYFIINEAVPTAVSSLVDVPSTGGVGLVKLPCLGSRGVITGLYSTIDDALRANDLGKVKKLYEAALSMPMRVRVGPSKIQVALDSITYSEDLHTGKAASTDSFFDFTAKSIERVP